jgi:hypothetical protein
MQNIKQICLTLAIGLLLICSSIASTSAHQQKSQESLTRYSPENCGLSLELPIQSAPEIIKLPVPKSMQAKIIYANFSFIQVGEMHIYYVHMSAIEYLPPKSVAEGTIDGMIPTRDLRGMVDIPLITEPSTDTQAPLKGTFKMNDVHMEINALILSKEKHTWHVTCVYKKSDKKAQEMGQRILASIRLDGSPCPEK